METKHQTIIFTDGSSRGNPGPGGWGTIIVDKNSGTIMELGSRETRTTNNQMELRAAVEGLKKAPKNSSVIVYTDSSYLINGITKWVKGWKNNGWQTKTKKDVLNRDIWEELDSVAAGLNIKWHQISGHVGVLGNERCDYIATSFADEQPIKLYKGRIDDYSLPGILNISADAEKVSNKKSDSSHSRAAAYSYVSMVNRKIETHATWAECEQRVKGTKGARYKKATSAEMEAKIKQEFHNI
ncbi:MAG: ribonuclease HI [Candidatus Paceibacterota bacterium]